MVLHLFLTVVFHEDLIFLLINVVVLAVYRQCRELFISGSGPVVNLMKNMQVFSSFWVIFLSFSSYRWPFCWFFLDYTFFFDCAFASNFPQR